MHPPGTQLNSLLSPLLLYSGKTTAFFHSPGTTPSIQTFRDKRTHIKKHTLEKNIKKLKTQAFRTLGRVCWCGVPGGLLCGSGRAGRGGEGWGGAGWGRGRGRAGQEEEAGHGWVGLECQPPAFVCQGVGLSQATTTRLKNATCFASLQHRLWHPLWLTTAPW